MSIISISLNDRILEEIDKIKDEMGFSGRSEVIRAGVRSLSAEFEEDKKLEGKIKSVLLMVHDESNEHEVSDIMHSFRDVVTTHIHTNLKGEKCLEIFVLDGDASRIKELIKLPKTNRKIEYVKLIVP